MKDNVQNFDKENVNSLHLLENTVMMVGAEY
jgi:hypothetical protein